MERARTPEFPSEVEISVDPCVPHWFLIKMETGVAS